MQTQSTHQPHDKLFKKAFTDLSTASALLKWQLPAKLVRDIDWKHLRLVSGNFIDEHFRASASDLLYRVVFRADNSPLYMILEHQRKEDPHLGVRLLGYMTRLWEQFQSEHPSAELLPPIISLVVSQSSRPWKTSLLFHDSLGIPNAHKHFLKRRCPNFEFLLMELKSIPYEEIIGTPLGKLTLKILKAKVENKLLEDVVWDETCMLQISLHQLKFLLTYICNFENIDRDQFREEGRKTAEKKIMSLADQFREEGRKTAEKKIMSLADQFREEGRKTAEKETMTLADQFREEGLTQLLKHQLRRKFRTLPKWTEKRFKTATMKDLSRWGDRILCKDTLEEIFE